MSDELKPCPLCASEAEADNSIDDNLIAQTYWVECTNTDCGITVYGDSAEESVAKWNTRQDTPVDDDPDLKLVLTTLLRGMWRARANRYDEWQLILPIRESDAFYKALTRLQEEEL